MLDQDIFNIQNQEEFKTAAISVFKYQFKNNPVYRNFCEHLRINPDSITELHQIPFLPIQFFKSHQITTGVEKTEKIFSSSGTTGSVVSKHHITNLSTYEKSFIRAFKLFYGNPDDYNILALLPSYLERKDSSLIYMVTDLIEKSRNPESGFYLHNLDTLIEILNSLEHSPKKTLLIGVSFALLDLAEKFPSALKNIIVMETGGMKGRRKELIREELHYKLKKGLGVKEIHSEYGMTELLSQAYSSGDGIFKCPPWMKVLIRDPEDALSILGPGKTGGVNIIDLANINSCAFIATQDLGKIRTNKGFEVLGRFDNSDIRGCNLMAL